MPPVPAAAPPILPVNGNEVFTILWVIVVLAFMVERALAVPFEHRAWQALERDFHLRGLKELLAVLLAYQIGARTGFDALALMFHQPSDLQTRLVTALIIAGGSKGAVKLMQDVLGIKKPAAGASRPRSGKA